MSSLSTGLERGELGRADRAVEQRDEARPERVVDEARHVALELPTRRARA